MLSLKKQSLLVLLVNLIGFVHVETATYGAQAEYSDAYNTTTEPQSSGVLSSNSNDVKFYLWPYPSNLSYYEELVYNDSSSLNTSAYNSSKPTKFLVHGFLSNGLNDDGYPGNAKDAYLKRDKDHSYNVISVDWGNLATPSAGPFSALFYAAVVKNIEIAGQRLGHFIVWLYNISVLQLDSTHLVGHSLGCHVSGWAGDTVTNVTGQQVGRISALDPAGPLFYTDIPARTIRPFDAKFVDAYHTCAGALGTPKSVGAVDFFVNGGIAPQPGCFPEVIGCSHSRAHQYFTQTILEDDPARNSNASRCVCVSATKFTVYRDCCDHKFLFGEYCSQNAAGKYYIRYELEGQEENDVTYGNKSISSYY